jgi:hypothetical protein
MGTNCGPVLTDLFLPAGEADFFHGLLKKKLEKRENLSRPLIPASGI